MIYFHFLTKVCTFAVQMDKETITQLITILVFIVAIVISTMAYPIVIRFAKRHDSVDNPHARKLQRVPVPILGGVVVYIGIIAGMIVLFLFLKESLLLWGLLAMTVLMLIGIWDDIRELSVSLRFVMEIAMVTLFILRCGSLLGVGFEKVYLLQNDLNIAKSEIISTYLYKMGLRSNQYSYSAAIGLFNNVVNFVILILVNAISRKISDTSLF